MNIKKFVFYAFCAVFPLNYSLFCPKDELRQIELNNDAVWSTPEIFQNQDGVIKGLSFPKIRLILRGPNVIVVAGPHKLFLVDLTILPNNPDALSIKDKDAEVIIEHCTFFLDGTNFNFSAEKIEIVGNVEFIGLNPNMIKRSIGWLISSFFPDTEAFVERFVLDYSLVTFPASATFTKGDKDTLLFNRTIFEKNWVSNKKPKRVHFQNPVST